jgi:hypothetical protein
MVWASTPGMGTILYAVFICAFSQPPTNASVGSSNFVIIFLQYSWYFGIIFNVYYELIM